MRIAFPVFVFTFLIHSACPSQTGAERTGGSSIVANSPFLPAEFSPPGGAAGEAEAPASGSRFQFTGVYQLDGEYYFHLHDQGSRSGRWIGLNSPVAGYPRILQFHEGENLLVVELGGERLQLAMTGPDGSGVAVVSDNSTTGMAVTQHPAGAMPGGRAVRRPVIGPGGEAGSGPALRRVLFSHQPPNH